MNSQGRKRSYSPEDFRNALDTTWYNIMSIVRHIGKNYENIKFIVCFSSSIVLRACDEKNEYYQQCLEYLEERYRKSGKITQDCDLIFEEDPPEELQAYFRKWNRTQYFTIDWWESHHYVDNPWTWVKDHGLQNCEIVNDTPLQPFKDLIWTKKNLLHLDPKHKEDIKYLPKL